MVYGIFNTETAFGLAKGKESNIGGWYECMKEMLDPAITLLNESDQQKIIALIAKEKAELDNRDETRNLFERFMNYI